MTTTAHGVVFPTFAPIPAQHSQPPSDELTLAALHNVIYFCGLFAKELAAVWGFRPLANSAEHVAVELVTRAVETTGNPDPHPSYIELSENPPPLIGIRVSRQSYGLLIDVWDNDPTSPLPTTGQYLDQHLVAVHETCHRWNWYRHGHGKVIWAELAIPEPRASEPLPRRVPARFSYPKPTEPVKPMQDLDLLHSVLDGLHRLDESGSHHGQL